MMRRNRGEKVKLYQVFVEEKDAKGEEEQQKSNISPLGDKLDEKRRRRSLLMDVL